MALSPTEDQQVQDCIKELLSEHIKQPFGLIREAGVVAGLHALLLDRAFPKPVPVAGISAYPRSKDGQADPFQRHGILDTLRVQLEIQLALSGKRYQSSKVLDLAVLTEKPKLYCAKNGAGDVVQQLDTGSISAAIEVKASPSSMPEQRGYYVKDIWALLELRKEHGIAGYFVLLDKTSPLYGQPALKAAAGVGPMVWDSSHLQQIVLRRGKQGDLGFDSLSAAGLMISATPPEPPHVQIWTIDASAKLPVCWFASAAP